MPHVIEERSIAILKDEWQNLQEEEIDERWVFNEDVSFKLLDCYWDKVFQLMNGVGNPKYKYLQPVVKSCLCLQNGNADVERSFSDNKNCLTKERVHLSNESLKGLRRAK